MKVLIPYI